MQKPDYFAEFRPLFNKTVADQKADPEANFILIHFPVPVEEVAHVFRVTKLMIENGPEGEEAQVMTFFCIMFVIKMFDGIADRTQDPVLLHFKALEMERIAAMRVLRIITYMYNDEFVYRDEWANAMILIDSFIKRMERGNC
ncbi:MAG: hypothetical protein LBS05_07895 [Tannerellaceae bacterium]|jgi:hypothetical protein|nr:hypothetical protein [Tannerellaceae bacterium]